jgi:hypothetical protein
MTRPHIKPERRQNYFAQASPWKLWSIRTGYQKTPKTRFRNHKRSAAKRGIPFLLSFEDWWTIWHRSDHWKQCGCRKGQYVMARFGDKGPYAIDNVEIVEATINSTAPHQGKRRTSKTKSKMAKARRLWWRENRHLWRRNGRPCKTSHQSTT